MNEIIKQYLKENLRLDIRGESYGFSGKHIVFRLKIEDEIISEEYVDVRRDEG